MYPTIQPNQYVALRLPSDAIKVEQIVPNTLISLGKYGSFQANSILGRPFHLTFEILDRSEIVNGRELRLIPAAELHADALINQTSTPGNGEEGVTPDADGGGVDQDALDDMRSNRNIIDDPMNQKLTMEEIEALKQDETGSSKDLIAKIMESHTSLDQKTAFSLAKYTLRKKKKYLKHFSVLPLDVHMLTDWMMYERDFGKVMEIRNEVLGLMGCWANVHSAGIETIESSAIGPSGRYLVVDDTGGLVTAAMAERMGILYAPEATALSEHPEEPVSGGEADDAETNSALPKPRKPHPESIAMSATSNSLTLIHANTQPNLALLRYFSFDANMPSPSHPLHSHLKSLTWLQLLEPTSDPVYIEPETVSPEIVATWKSSRRSTYYRKRRRWSRMKSVIDSTRSGNFNGLIVASFTSPASILHHCVPLLAGAAQVVVYSPNIEPLVELADFYSTTRRAAFISRPPELRKVPSDEFPVDPTLLLVPMVQKARVKRWQVLPGRTHPLMMGKGGAEGYVFVATRVLPADGKVEARGNVSKRRKVEGNGTAVTESIPEGAGAAQKNGQDRT